MILTIDVSSATAHRLQDDPVALRRAGELVDAEFRDEDADLTEGEWAKIHAELADFEAGRREPHSQADALQLAQELLQITGLSISPK